MAYSDFTLNGLIERFGLSVRLESGVFERYPPAPVSALLTETLNELVPLALDIGTEKSRSELIIAPILAEVRRQLKPQVSLFLGVELNVDSGQGLVGVCDYVLSLSDLQLTLQAPVVAVVEAKNENIRQGINQCTAEMVAAHRFNEQRGKPVETVYGAVTTGNLWRFLMLTDAAVTVDEIEYHVSRVERIVGVLVGMIRTAQQSLTRPLS